MENETNEMNAYDDNFDEEKYADEEEDEEDEADIGTSAFGIFNPRLMPSPKDFDDAFGI